MIKSDKPLKFYKYLFHQLKSLHNYMSESLVGKTIVWWSDKDNGWKISDIRDNCLIEENMSIDFDRHDKKESVVNHFVPIQYRHDYYQEDKYTIKNVLAFIEEFSITASEKRIGNFKNMQNDYRKKQWSKMSLINKSIIGRIDYEEDDEE